MQPSWIPPSWIQSCCTKPWLNLIQPDSNSFILTQLDDGSHLEFYHLGFSQLSFSSQTHSHLPRLVLTICTKRTSFIYSDSTWWWQPSWILPCWIQTLPSWIQTPCYLLSDSFKNHSHSIPTLTQTNSIWLKLIQSINLMMATILNSAILDSAILHKTLTQTSSIWLKLIQLDSTWWWQPSRILECWIQTLPSWFEIPCYLLSDSFKNHSHSILTLTQTNSFWLKLIQSY